MDFGKKFAFKLPRSILRTKLFHSGKKKGFLVEAEEKMNVR